MNRPHCGAGAGPLKVALHSVIFGLFLAAGWNAVSAAERKSLGTAKDGRQTMNGLVSPLDQEGKNFYLRNEDGLTEIKLTADAKIGLLFRERDIRKMFEKRKIVLKSVGQEHPLPADIYVKVRFRDWRSAQNAIQQGKLQAGILYTTPLKDHLPTATELWFSGRISAFKKGHITPAAEVVKRHPEITTCDQWQFVKDRENDIYKEWWAGKNVHFKGEPAAALGKLLAKHVLKVLGK